MAKTAVAKSRGPKAGRHGKLRASAKDGATENNRNWPATSLSERKSIEQLAAEQGTKPTRLEDILGKGADLWESDQEFDQFVEDIYDRRSEDRELAKQ